jgi:arylsulfatase A-like enzyme
VREQVALLDLAPTLAHLGGVPWPVEGEGRDLAPVIARAAQADTAAVAVVASDTPPFFAESGENLLGPFNPNRFLPGIEGKLRSIRTDRWKLILAPQPNGRRALALYDLQSDPAETTDVYASQFAQARELEKALDEFLAKDRVSKETSLAEVDAETREKLRTMGYLH